MAATELPQREREALLRVVTASAAVDDLDGVVKLAATEALAAVGAASLSISRFEDDGRMYRTLVNVGDLGAGETARPADEIYEVDRYPQLHEMRETGRPYFNSIDDPQTDTATVELLSRLGKSSDLGVAIEIEGERWGGIWATTHVGAPNFRSEDLNFLEAIAAQVGAAVSRSEMFSRVSRLAYEDPLTGLANRRALEERLERASVRYAKGEIDLSILLCDVDRLKITNDARGHAAGDDALRTVAAALVTSAADYPGSFVGRIGGDEFCVLLETRREDPAGPDYPLVADLGAAAQRLLAVNGRRGAHSVSCGVATAGPQTSTPAQLLSAADAAQYLAKRRGGNRVCTAAQVAEQSSSDVVPVPPGGYSERFWETAEEIARTLDGELVGVATLDRLEVVAAAFTAAGDFARWAISFAAHGTDFLRDVALGDNRERRRTGARVAPGYSSYEMYDLDDYPLTREIVAAGSGSFLTRIDDPAGDPSEQALLVREGFTGVIGVVATDSLGTYLIELVADRDDAPLEEVDAPLRLAARSALSPQPHKRDGARGGDRYSRALDLALSLPARLAHLIDEQQVCEAVAEELRSSFGCSVAQVVGIDGDRFVLRAERGVIETEDGWEQGIDAGLMGRCLAEGGPVVSRDVTREPGYRSSDSSHDVRSELVAPIPAPAGGQWGVINLEDTQIGSFTGDDAQILTAAASLLGGALNSIGLYQKLDRAYIGTAQALTAALEAKDSPTAEHSESIARNAVAVGRRLGMEAEELRMLRYAAAFHDIGKIAIPRHILTKSGPLDDEERAAMSQHTVIGERILKPIEFLQPIRPVVRHAHERWDGGGYPDGLAGEAIPLAARIIFACDAYDAMIADRPYSEGMTSAEARAELEAGSGAQFDPRVIVALLEVLSASTVQR